MLWFVGPVCVLLWMHWQERVGRRKKAEAAAQQQASEEEEEEKEDEEEEKEGEEEEEVVAEEEEEGEVEEEEREQMIEAEQPENMKNALGEQEVQVAVNAEEEEELFLKGEDSDPDSENDRLPLEEQEEEMALGQNEKEEEEEEEALEAEETAAKQPDQPDDSNGPEREDSSGDEGEIHEEEVHEHLNLVPMDVHNLNQMFDAAMNLADAADFMDEMRRVIAQFNIYQMRDFHINVQRNILQVNWTDTEELRREMEEQRRLNERMEETMQEFNRRLEAVEGGHTECQQELAAKVEEGRRKVEELEDKIRRQEQILQTFVFRVEGRFTVLMEDLLSRAEKGELDSLVMELLQDFNIHLIGISTEGIIMDVPEAQWEEIRRRQGEIKARLDRLFPGVTWQAAIVTNGPIYDEAGNLRFPVQDSGDAPLPDTQEAETEAEESPGLAAPVPDSNDMRQHDDLFEMVAGAMDRRMGGTSGRRINFDPMLGEPQLSSPPFSPSMPSLEEDSSAELVSGYHSAPELTSLVLTDDNILLMADKRNMMIKKLPWLAAHSPQESVGLESLEAIRLAKAPWAMCILHDGSLAVTTSGGKVIYLISIHRFDVIKEIPTGRAYDGIGQGESADTLVVSYSKEEDLEASVELISIDGGVLRTITNVRSLTTMEAPKFLFVSDGRVMVSDQMSDRIFIVHLASGMEEYSLVNPDLKSPRQIVADAAGNIYVACYYAQAVFVRTVDEKWRRLLSGREHAGSGHVYPHGLAVAENGLVVAWRGETAASGTIITFYDLTKTSNN